MSKQFSIKITGSGSKQAIVETLKNVLNDIENTEVDDLDGSEWEGATLFTEVKEAYNCKVIKTNNFGKVTVIKKILDNNTIGIVISGEFGHIDMFHNFDLDDLDIHYIEHVISNSIINNG